VSKRAYLDTSSYLAVLLGEREAPAVLARLRGLVLCTSTLLLVEAERNLLRLARERIIKTDQFQQCMAQLLKDREAMILRDFTGDLALTGEFPLVCVPRSLDLIHLRTAKWFAAEPPGLRHFETLDEAQASAARELGLPLD
jgi:hypothetical protein